MDNLLITTKRAGEIIGVSTRRIVQFIKDGRLPAMKVGRDWLIGINDLEKFSDQERCVGRPKSDNG